MNGPPGLLFPAQARRDRRWIRRRLLLLMFASLAPLISGLGLVCALQYLGVSRLSVGLLAGLVATVLPAALAWRLADAMARSLETLILSAEMQNALAETDPGSPLAVHGNRLLLLGRMTSGLVHELNQPLTAIAAYSAAGGHSAAAAPEVRELLKKIDLQVERAGVLLARVRGFARRRSERGQVELPALIKSVTEWSAAEAQRLSIGIEIVAALAPMPALRADRLQIEQVLINLLHNAFDAVSALPPRSLRRVVIGYGLAEGEAMVWVRDNGPGVPADVVKDLFKPFFTTKPTGLGLGLSISRAIVENHGGRMWHTPGPRGGSCFHFSLPLSESSGRSLEPAS